MKDKLEKAIFAAGCFWGIEDAFRKIKGVKDAVSGYTGGHTENPTYEKVCGGGTGHAEAVEVVFDPDEVSYKGLVDIFWNMHNPTSVNRQGPDVGEQYRSAIFFLNDEQKEVAEKSKEDLERFGKFNNPIATEITKAGMFYKAEEYHQRYFEKRGGGTCHI